MKINDLDFSDNVLGISKVVDKAPDSDSYIRESGVISYPSMYEIEKVSVTLGIDIEKEESLNKYIDLVAELDSYPLVFIEDVNLKEMVVRFTDRDGQRLEENYLIFMIDSFHLSISSQMTNLITVNLRLRPFSFHGIAEDYSFLSYEGDPRKDWKILMGDSITPESSLIFKDFFAKDKEKAKVKIKNLISSSLHSSVMILAPHFTDEKPPEELESKEIVYLDISGVDEDGEEKDPLASYPYFSGKDKVEDKFQKKKYVYWKGDNYSVWNSEEVAVYSVEYSHHNTIVTQPIVGKPFPLIQYIGSAPNTLSITLQQNETNTIVTPQTVLTTILEKYNQNMFYESRFSAFNIFKIDTILSTGSGVEGFVPSQTLVQKDSDSQMAIHKIIFIESSPSLLQRVSDPNIYSGNKKYSDSVIPIPNLIVNLHNYFLDAGIVDKKNMASLMPMEMNKALIREMIITSKGSDNEELDTILTFYKALADDFYSMANDNDRYNNEEKVKHFNGVITFWDYVSTIENKKFISPMLSREISGLSLSRKDEFQRIGLTTAVNDYFDEAEEEMFEGSLPFTEEALFDIRIGERLGISQSSPYLGISDPRKVGPTPFLSFVPLISRDLIYDNYVENKGPIEEAEESVFGDRNLLHSYAKTLPTDRRLQDLGLEEDTFPVRNTTRSIPSSVNNLVKWIGSKDAGKVGFEGLTTIYGKGSFSKHGIDVTKMTVAEVLSSMKDWTAQNIARMGRKKGNSSATGKYQVVSGTLALIVKSGVISMNSLFNEETQDLCGFWLATQKSSERKGAYKNFIAKKHSYLSRSSKPFVEQGRIKSDYEEARLIYAESLSWEWAILENPRKGKGNWDGDGMNKAHVTKEELFDIMDRLPVWDEVYNKVEAPEFKKAEKIPGTITGSTAEMSKVEESKNSSDTKESKSDFLKRWASRSLDEKPSQSKPFTISKNEDNPLLVNPNKTQISRPDNITFKALEESSVFNNDTMALVQARDAASIFHQGTSIIFPVVKVFVVYGGQNSDESEYALVNPNYIEITGVIKVEVGLNDKDNPVDVAKVEVANPLNIYSDQKTFWDLYRKRIDFSKLMEGDGDELNILQQAMTLASGNRVQIRAGYGNNTNDLDIIFNGVILDIGEGQTLTFIAEGHGRELLLKEYGKEKPEVLSSETNSSAPLSIADLLFRADEISSFGKRMPSLPEIVIRKTLLTFLGGEDLSSPVYYEPESRALTYFQEFVDDTWTSLNFDSEISKLSYRTRTDLIKNIYPEVFAIDTELQYSLLNLFSFTRNINNYVYAMGGTIWETIRVFEYRHPNTYLKPMIYDSGMTLFYGIKDQLYLSKPVNRKLAIAIEEKNKAATALYYRNRYKRFSAVSQYFFVSSGVNLISNRIKLSSNFYTQLNVEVSTNSSPDNEENYWEDSSKFKIALDDNLAPRAVREKDFRLNGTDLELIGVRAGSQELAYEASCMYDGKITITGNAKMKNGDKVFLFDSTRMLYGFVSVSECVHYFSATLGFITEFRPKLIAEVKAPIFSLFSRKMMAAMISSHSSILESLMTSAEKSTMYDFTTRMIEQAGVFSPGSGVYTLGGTIFGRIMALLDGDKRASDLALVLGGDIASTALFTFLGITTLKGAKSLLSFTMPAKTLRYLASNKYYSGVTGWVGSAFIKAGGAGGLRGLTSTAFSLSSSVIMKAALGTGTLLTSTVKTGSLVVSLLRAGSYVDAGRVLFSTGRLTIASVSAVGLSNPLSFLFTAVAYTVVSVVIDNIELELLKRDPLAITPLMSFGRPYVGGVTGAKDNGLFDSSVENVKRTIKALTTNIAKIKSKAEYSSSQLYETRESPFLGSGR